MHIWPVYAFNVSLYILFPLLIGIFYRHNRINALYIYLSAVLLWGGLAGTVYSFRLTDNLSVSGGNIAYGAFMMVSVILIITERSRATFFNIIRILIGVNALVFTGFNFLRFILRNEIATNPLSIPYAVFEVSFRAMITGGFLIFTEILLLLAIFISFSKKIKSITGLSLLYVASYIAVLCLDGLLFPVIALGVQSDLIAIIIGNFPGKIILASSFAIPLLAYLVLNSEDVEYFSEARLRLKDIVNYRFERLVKEIYKYEKREKRQREKIETLIDLSGKDQLTSIANRRKFEEFFEREWSRAQRDKKT